MASYQQPLLSEGAGVGSVYISKASKTVRNGFVKKVYGILAAQIALTTLVAYPFVTGGDEMLRWEVGHSWVLGFSACMTLAVMCAGMCSPNLFRSFPTNYIMLSIFTFFEAVTVGFFCSCFQTQSVLLAFGMTVGIFCALTAYAMTTKTDFTQSAFGSYLLIALTVMCLTGLFLMIFPNIPFLQQAYAGAGACLFSFYLVYDTQLIVGGGHRAHQFQVDEYVFAALNLYLDLINLFLDLLRIMGQERQN